MERFWTKVDRGGPDDCWPWTAYRNEHGYGRFILDTKARKWELAHRTAYRLTTGPIPAGLLVLHSCDNPPCCNPAHLRIGTHSDNNRDAYARGGRDPRLITRVVSDYVNGERHGMSKLTAEQVREIRRRLAAGESQGQLSKVYGVGQPAISSVARRRTWRHLS